MEENITPGQIGKKYGLIYGLIALLVALIPMIMEIQSTAMAFIPPVIALVIYIFADKEFRNANGGFMSFGEGFKINIIAATIAGSMRSVVTYVYVKFIDPTYNERMQEVAFNRMREQGMSEEQIEQAVGFTRGISNPEIGLFFGIVWALLGALIIGSIVAAIIKNEHEESF